MKNLSKKILFTFLLLSTVFPIKIMQSSPKDCGKESEISKASNLVLRTIVGTALGSSIGPLMAYDKINILLTGVKYSLLGASNSRELVLYKDPSIIKNQFFKPLIPVGILMGTIFGSRGIENTNILAKILVGFYGATAAVVSGHFAEAILDGYRAQKPTITIMNSLAASLIGILWNASS